MPGAANVDVALTLSPSLPLALLLTIQAELIERESPPEATQRQSDRVREWKREIAAKIVRIWVSVWVCACVCVWRIVNKFTSDHQKHICHLRRINVFISRSNKNTQYNSEYNKKVELIFKPNLFINSFKCKLLYIYLGIIDIWKTGILRKCSIIKSGNCFNEACWICTFMTQLVMGTNAY